MPKAIEVVYFDYGNVLSLTQNEELREELWNLVSSYASGQQDFWSAHFSHRHEYDRDGVDAQEYWRRVFRVIGSDPSEDLRKLLIEVDDLSWSGINHRTVAWAKAVKAAGFRIGILSNMPSRFFRKILTPQPWIEIFDHVVISGEVGMVKPDPEIYRYAAKLAGTKPERILFFDDTPRNVEAARNMGFEAHVFTSLEETPSALLEAYGIPPPGK